jgi:hypothetical protein
MRDNENPAQSQPPAPDLGEAGPRFERLNSEANQNSRGTQTNPNQTSMLAMLLFSQPPQASACWCVTLSNSRL